MKKKRISEIELWTLQAFQEVVIAYLETYPDRAEELQTLFNLEHAFLWKHFQLWLPENVLSERTYISGLLKVEWIDQPRARSSVWIQARGSLLVAVDGRPEDVRIWLRTDQSPHLIHHKSCNLQWAWRCGNLQPWIHWHDLALEDEPSPPQFLNFGKFPVPGIVMRPINTIYERTE